MSNLKKSFLMGTVVAGAALCASAFFSILAAHAACTNPSTIPPGFTAPCPVFSLSSTSITQSQTLTLSATPQAGTDYIYTTAYVSEGTTWNPYTLQGNNAYPAYSSALASLTLSSTQLQSLSLGTHYAVVWDWLWDATAQCYKGPGLNQCNTGTWRVQSFSLTSSATPTPTPPAYTYSQSSYYAYSQSAYTSASVAVDAVGPGATGAAMAAGSSLSWTHTVGASGTNRLLVVGTTGNCPASVTYNGTALAQAGQVYNNNNPPATTQLFYLVAPPTGAHTVNVAYSACTSDLEAGSISFTGVNQTTPLRNVTKNFGSGTVPSVAVPSAAGDMVVDMMGNGGSILSSNQTLRWLNNQNGNTAAGNGAQSTAPGASSVTMSYAVSSDWWGIIGADVAAAGATYTYSQSSYYVYSQSSYTSYTYSQSSYYAYSQAAYTGGTTPWTGILAPSRATDWSGAGVEGGIPSGSWTQCGATVVAGASTATIQTSIDNCTANHYVLLGAGTFNISGLNLGNSRVALRGSGANQTILNISSDGPTSCFIGLSSAINMCSGSNSQTIVNWTAGYSLGTTQITLSSVAGLTVGTPIILEQLDDSSDGWPATGDLYVCESTSNNCSNQGGGSDGYYPDSPNRSNMEMVRATAISGTTVTINPPITLPNYRSGQSPHAVYYGNGVFQTYAGIENLSLNYTGLQTGIRMTYCDNCWIKGVRIINTSSSAGSDVHNVMPVLSFHVTVKNNYFYGDQCGTGCILNYQDMPMVDGSILWENNILQGLQAALIPNGPYSNSVFAYNFFTGRPDSAVLLHNAGEMMDLVEGNIMNGWVGDIDHGTHFFETLFRNAIVSYKYAAGPGNINTAVEAHTNNRFINVVGNVMGHSHFTTYETNQAANDNAVFNLGWQGNISGTAVTNDPNVKRTLLRWGNWDSVTNAVRWCVDATAPCTGSEVPSGITNFSNPVPANHTLPASFYYSSKPSWWPSAKPWPPIGPDVTGGNITNLAGHANTNPAADCYLNVLGGPTDGSGNPLAFNAASCYP